MVRKSKGLGERHQSILEFLREYQRENKYPPSIREIGEKTGISSMSVVNYYLDQLEKKGLIERDRKISRGVRLHSPGEKFATIAVPLLGPIAAGIPITIPPADFPIEDVVYVPLNLLPKRSTHDVFALRVQGDSMRDAMVMDGDVVILKSTKTIQSGDMVAAWLPEQEATTLKYYAIEKRSIVLRPANPAYKPLILSEEEVDIQGKVLAVLRNLDVSRPPGPAANASYSTSTRKTFNSVIEPKNHNISRFVLINIKNPDRPLTPFVLENEVLPYINSIEVIQKTLDSLNHKNSPVRVISITHNSPESVTLDGVTKAVEFIINRIDPLRKELAELNKKSLDADIHLKNAQAAGVMLDNQKKLIDLGKEKINVLVDILEKSDGKLSDDIRSQLISAISRIISSNLQIELQENKFEKNETVYLQ